jgi:hypothetical protein
MWWLLADFLQNLANFAQGKQRKKPFVKFVNDLFLKAKVK